MFWWAYILSYLCFSEAAALLESSRVSRKYQDRQSSKLIDVLVDKRRKRLLGGEMYDDQIQVSRAAETKYLDESKEIYLRYNKYLPAPLRLYADWGYTMDSKSPLKEECHSTAYYPNYSWLAVKKRNSLIREPRQFLTSLRNEMYEKADAEKCHTPEMTNVLDFLDCQIRRHMRLELEIPKYPDVPK